MSSQPEASTSRLLPASPAATSTPRASSSSASSSRLQLARQAALSQSSAGGDKHTQALVRASQNRTTAGGRSLDRQVILEEDDYAEALDRIIKRDFFPELARLDATNEYLAAVEAMDEGRLEQSVRALWEIEGETGETPRFPGGRQSETPVPFDRPRRKAIPSSASTIARAAHLPTLDKFQARHTSEDNASFTSILSSENSARKTKMGWAYAQEEAVRKRVEAAEGKWRRLLEDVPRSKDERERMVEAARVRERLRISGPAGLDDLKGRGKAREILAPPSLAAVAAGEASPSSSSSMVVAAADANSEALVCSTTTDGLPHRQPLSPPLPPTDLPLATDSHLAVALRSAGLPATRTDDAALAAHDERSATIAARAKKEETNAVVDAWPWKARNSLMFPPDVDVSPHDLPLPSSSSSLPTGPPREIKHDATRLPDDFAYSAADRRSMSGAASSVSGNSPTRSEVAAAISGTTYHRAGTSATPRPHVGAYPLVAPLPSPTASSLGPARISELLTWGTLLSTPRALEGGNVGGWTIKPPSKRDELGRKLAGQSAKSVMTASPSLSASSKRQRLDGTAFGPGGGLMLPPSSTMTGRKTLAGMSPAARGLSERIKTSSGSLTPRASSSSSFVTGRSSGGGRQRGEAMERAAAWTGTKGTTSVVDLGRRRWSESPSPRVSRAKE